jgi:outer membrane protein OmpA-like peptidoglycan-associated protein
MTTAPPRRPHDTGAYRDDRRRRGGAWWWWLLGLVILAAIVAVIVILLAEHHHHSKQTAAVVPVSTAPAIVSPTVVPTTAVPPTSSTATPATSGSALVGGGGIAAKPATGSEAASGVVGTVLFAEASATIDGTGDQVITAAAQQLKASGVTTITVTGYTDIIAGQTVNAKLSEERADAVAAKLRTLLPGITVTATAKGQADPLASNLSAAGRAQNRRAVITGS